MFRKPDTTKRGLSPERGSGQAFAQATPLHAAAASGNLEDVKVILRNRKRGYSVEALDEHGRTAVWYAIWEGHTVVARTLLDNKFCPCAFPVDARDKSGRTAAEIAKSYGRIREYQHLVSFDECIAREVEAARHEEEEWQKLSNTPIEFEVPAAKPVVVKKHKFDNLFQPAAPVQFGVTTELHRAVARYGSTLSQQQCRPGRLKQILMDPDVVVDAVDEEGYTSLFLAAYYGREDEAAVLLESGADKYFVSPNAKVKSPFQWVCDHGSIRMMELMGLSRQDINLQMMIRAFEDIIRLKMIGIQTSYMQSLDVLRRMYPCLGGLQDSFNQILGARESSRKILAVLTSNETMQRISAVIYSNIDADLISSLRDSLNPQYGLQKMSIGM